MSDDSNEKSAESETVVEKTEPAAEVVEAKPAAAPKKKAAVITPNVDADPVYLSRCVFKNPFARKSLTVHHLQRRLHDLGFKDAYSDKDGWYGDLTAKSVKEFQEASGLEATGLMNAVTFEAIFAGDHAVVINVAD